MQVDYVSLGWTVTYLLGVLGVGLWYLRRVKRQADFAKAGQSLPPLLACGSLLATNISAVSVIGGSGYASQYGFALLTLFTTGTMAGCGFLALTADKWQRANVNSVSELMAVRYDSVLLRSLLAAIIVIAYAVILVAQLFGIGHILEGLIGVRMGLAILVVGSVIVLYTFLGGLVSVARTDTVHAFFLLLGLLVTAVALIGKLIGDPAHTFTEQTSLMTVFNGQTPDGLHVFAYVFVFGLGVAIHPYYVQRLLAAQDAQTARLAATVSAGAVLSTQVLLAVIGVIGAIYLPDEVGDSMLPAIVRELLSGPAGVIVTVSIVAAVVSTTDSLLHVIGTYISQDIIGPVFLQGPSDRELLVWSRVFTAVCGILIIGFAAYQAFVGEVQLIAVIGAYAWGLLGGSLFVAIAGGLFWRRANRAGALAAVVTGFLASVVGHPLVERGILPVHEILPAILLSCTGLVLVSLVTAPPPAHCVASVFDDVVPDPTSSRWRG